MRATRLMATHDIRTADVPVPEPGARRSAGPGRGGRHLRDRPPSLQGRVSVHAAGDARARVLGHRRRARRGRRHPRGRARRLRPQRLVRRCDACLRGRVNLCERNVATGIHRDGGFAEYAVFPAHKAVALPADLDPLHGAFCEPLACTLHGLDIGAPRGRRARPRDRRRCDRPARAPARAARRRGDDAA